HPTRDRVRVGDRARQRVRHAVPPGEVRRGWPPALRELRQGDERRVIVIPAIDLRGGKAVRLVRGDPKDVTVYADDPAEVAARFQEEGARRLHVIDIDAALERGETRDTR